MRGRRGPPALPDRRRALEPLAHRKPRRPDVLQALRRASRLARHPRRSLQVRELRRAHRYILLTSTTTISAVALATAAIALTTAAIALTTALTALAAAAAAAELPRRALLSCDAGHTELGE